MEEKTTKNCPKCGKAVKGRIDKKFCSEFCRNASNNERGFTDHKKTNSINGILKKNRQVLERLNAQRIKKVSKEQLLQMDFNFYYFTHINTASKGVCCFFCYDYGYYLIEKDCYKLVNQV